MKTKCSNGVVILAGLMSSGCLMPPATHAPNLAPALLLDEPMTEAAVSAGGNTIGMSVGRVTPLSKRSAYDLNVSAGLSHAAIDGGHWRALKKQRGLSQGNDWELGMRVGGTLGAGNSVLAGAMYGDLPLLYELSLDDVYAGGSVHWQMAREKRRGRTSVTGGLGLVMPAGMFMYPLECDLYGCIGYMLNLYAEVGVRRDFSRGFIGVNLQSITVIPVPMLSAGFTF